LEALLRYKKWYL